MKIIIEPSASGNVLATTVIGKSYMDAWEKNALPGWKRYCKRYGLGIIAFDQDLLKKDDPKWKKANWQKLLIGSALSTNSLPINNVCFLDSDILINDTAPNIFQRYDSETIGLVSLRQGLPYPYDEILKRMAFFRHNFYSSSYPLDSVLFISLEKLYKHHNLTPQQDESCTGLILFNINNHAKIMRDWFMKYDSNVQSLTNGGDQTHINFEIQNLGKVSWLDYKFQAIWVFEMAWKYPFLYHYGRDNHQLIRECIEASLYSNYFLHFAGSWYESEMWKLGGIFETEQSINMLEKYIAYINASVTGEPKGLIKPN